MNCTCEDWKANIDKITEPSALLVVRIGKASYEGKPFQYCPWCGNSLSVKRSYSVMIHAGGDTLVDLLYELNHFNELIDRGHEQTISGGVSSGGYFVVKKDPEMTHEKYAAALDERNKQ